MVYTVKLSASPPSHSAYVRHDGTVVVEWYDLAKDRPYESASMLLFDAQGQVTDAIRLERKLGGLASPYPLLTSSARAQLTPRRCTQRPFAATEDGHEQPRF
jgi:hypothetical protein